MSRYCDNLISYFFVHHAPWTFGVQLSSIDGNGCGENESLDGANNAVQRDLLKVPMWRRSRLNSKV